MDKNRDTQNAGYPAFTPAPHANLQSRGDCDVIIEFLINFFCFRDQIQWFLKESPEMVEWM